MSVSDWSLDPALNTTVGGINIAENCPAGNLNNAIREVMAQLRDYYNGQSRSYPLSIADGGTGKSTALEGLAALGGASRLNQQVNRSASFTFGESDTDKHQYWTGGAGIAVLPANSLRALQIGTPYTIVNNGSGVLEIRHGDGTPNAVIKWLPGGQTGYRQLAVNGIAHILKVEANLWIISGWGIS